jgi:hypothetical protein
MSTRITEFIDQCTRRAMWPGDPDVGEFNKEKFAELIIAECVSVIEKEDRQLEVSTILCKFSTRAAIDKAAQSGGLKVHTKGIVDSVKRHFGIK